MKNLRHYTDDAFEFHKDVLKSKKTTIADPTYKDRVKRLENAVQSQFSVYDNNFVQNTLEDIESHGHTASEKSDLLKLYSYKISVIKKLKAKLTTTATNRIISTCPNCTISEINSFDHYLPKEEFPEFVVNPKNLFPSCTTCNGYKSTTWLKGDKRLFLNLYLDHLPEEQYLFVKLKVETDSVITAKFYLQNTGTIASDIFEIIESHYERLRLLQRFSENINEVVTSLENTINSFIDKLPIAKIREAVIEKSNKDKLAFGHNYWKSILEIALVTDVEYLKRFN
ncbi:hypothetical protein AGMMS49982_09870 [Bacteroidia bacterium]|nr:hypothetical protein AGMMS49982_09870 [Bacteroidia bacterium]